MADYVKLEDIKDEVLKCTNDDIAAANAYVEQTARSLGVDTAAIPAPAPFIVNRLGICFACYNRAMLDVGSDPTANLDGRETRDIYEQKRKLYLAELERIRGTLTAAGITGGAGGGAGGVTLSRA